MKSVTKKTCTTCKKYEKLYCKEFNIRITSIENARLCSKYVPCKDVKVESNKRRKRCNTCTYFEFNMTLYKCTKKNKKLMYTALMYCDEYKKADKAK